MLFAWVIVWLSAPSVCKKRKNNLYFQYITLHFRLFTTNLFSFIVWCYVSAPSVNRNLTLSNLRIPPTGVTLWDFFYYIDNLDGLSSSKTLFLNPDKISLWVFNNHVLIASCMLYTLYTFIVFSGLTIWFIEKSFMNLNPRVIISLYGGSILLIWTRRKHSERECMGALTLPIFFGRVSDLHRGTL